MWDGHANVWDRKPYPVFIWCMNVSCVDDILYGHILYGRLCFVWLCLGFLLFSLASSSIFYKKITACSFYRLDDLRETGRSFGFSFWTTAASVLWRSSLAGVFFFLAELLEEAAGEVAVLRFLTGWSSWAAAPLREALLTRLASSGVGAATAAVALLALFTLGCSGATCTKGRTHRHTRDKIK